MVAEAAGCGLTLTGATVTPGLYTAQEKTGVAPAEQQERRQTLAAGRVSSQLHTHADAVSHRRARRQAGSVGAVDAGAAEAAEAAAAAAAAPTLSEIFCGWDEHNVLIHSDGLCSNRQEGQMWAQVPACDGILLPWCSPRTPK